jgi:hypothetical protein
MSDLREKAIGKFFEFYQSDIDSEVLDDSNVVISFPVHFSGFHRVEMTITEINADHFVISDGAKTIEELKSSGYVINSKLRDRIELISRTAKIRVVDDYLVSESNAALLGSTMQRFLEAAKTIGDAYLVQRTTAPKDINLLNRVMDLLRQEQVLYQVRHSLHGKIEDHKVDLYFPPNGVPGLALSVMGNPTRQAAEAWAFKSYDIKSVDQRTRVGVVYDAEQALDNSKAILDTVADVSVPSTDMGKLTEGMREIGILKNFKLG